MGLGSENQVLQKLESGSGVEAEPAQFIGRERDVQAVEAGARFLKNTWADERERGEWLIEHVRQRDVDRRAIFLLR